MHRELYLMETKYGVTLILEDSIKQERIVLELNWREFIGLHWKGKTIIDNPVHHERDARNPHEDIIKASAPSTKKKVHRIEINGD